MTPPGDLDVKLGEVLTRSRRYVRKRLARIGRTAHGGRAREGPAPAIFPSMSKAPPIPPAVLLHHISTWATDPPPRSPEWWREPYWRDRLRRPVRRARIDARRATVVYLSANFRCWDTSLTWRSMADRLGIARSTLAASVSRRRYLELAGWAIREWQSAMSRESIPHLHVPGMVAARKVAGYALEIRKALEAWRAHTVGASDLRRRAPRRGCPVRDMYLAGQRAIRLRAGPLPW